MWLFGKVLTVITAYTAGSILASSLDPKKKKKIKKIKEEGWDVFGFLINDFVDTHKKLLESAKEEILSPENKEKFEQKKAELLELAGNYKKEAEKVMADLKIKAIEKAKDGLVKVDEMYEQQKEKIGELKEIAPEKAKELKDTLLAQAKEIKDEISKKIKS